MKAIAAGTRHFADAGLLTILRAAVAVSVAVSLLLLLLLWGLRWLLERPQ